MGPQRPTAALAAALLLAACQSAGVRFDSVAVASWDARPPIAITGHLSMPDAAAGKSPAVVLLHSCGGLEEHVLHDWPAFLNRLGYVTLTVDSYGSRGLGPCPNGLERDDLQMMKDAYGALNFLAGRPEVRRDAVAVMGFSRSGGAIAALVDAHAKPRAAPEFAAGVILYGTCRALGAGTRPLYPLMVVIGNRDTRMVDSCRIVRNDAIEVHVLRGVYHAFDKAHIRELRYDFAGNPALYDAAATARARALTRAFLARRLRR